MKYTIKNAKEFLKKAKIDISKEKFGIKEITKGMNVELEHSSKDKRINVANYDLVTTGKIALAHLYEFPDYYERLEKIEQMGSGYKKRRFYLTYN